MFERNSSRNSSTARDHFVNQSEKCSMGKVCLNEIAAEIVVLREIILQTRAKVFNGESMFERNSSEIVVLHESILQTRAKVFNGESMLERPQQK